MKSILRVYILFFCCTIGIADVHAEKLIYQLDVDQQIYKTFHVSITVQELNRSRLVFSMPIWIPGAYYVESNGDHVLNFKAQSNSTPSLRVTRLSKNDWEVIPDGSTDVTVTYDVIPSDFSFIGEGLDSTGALIQAAGTWMYIRDFEHVPVHIKISVPAGWELSTALDKISDSNDFSAKNYDILADCPIMMGNLLDTTFVHLDKAYELHFRGEADFQLNKFTAMVRNIVEYQTALMGGAPFDRYVFQFTLFPGYRDGGGLEHANSASIGLSSIKIMKDVNSAANLIAHEFFHLWNVKRLTSDELLPLRYDREARMQSLWWLEGVTSYYADLTLLRCGIWSVDEFLDNQEKEIVLLQQNPDRLQTSVAQASWDIWENGYMSTHISYYNKGQLIGLLLDILIRKITRNNKSLDGVLLDLYRDFAQNSRGFADEQLEQSVEKVTGKDFDSFFDRYVTGLLELPYADILHHAGLEARIEEMKVPSLTGFRLIGSRNEIFSMDSSSAAFKSGLRRYDCILSIDGQSFSGDDELTALVREKVVGQIIQIEVEREKVTMKFDVTLEGLDKVNCQIDLIKNPSDEQLLIREGLIKGSMQKERNVTQ